MANDSVGPDILEAAIRGRLGRPLMVLETTASTNADALRWASEGAPHGALVVADHQTAGRGRWGRSWYSEPGAAILLSLVLRPRLSAQRVGLITTVLGVACAEALEESTGLRARIKWPNDLTIDGRKLAGILVETRVESGRVDVAVAGIGMNFHKFDSPGDIAAPVTSLAEEMDRAGLGPAPPRAVVVASLLARFEDLYDRLGGNEVDEVVARAAERSQILGEEVRVVLADGRALKGRAVRLLASGALELETGPDRVVVESGEVEHLRSE